MTLEEIKAVYFVGAGGIGMSALVRYFVRRGVAVAGYDKTSTPLTEQLEITKKVWSRYHHFVWKKPRL